MPIKSLESYLFERKLVNTSSIEILQNATIGIDVEHYLSRIYTFKKEQFLSGTGGIPSSLRDYIRSDLQVFKEFNVKPVFVIPGLRTQLQTHDYRTNELSAHEQHLENTWSKISSKNASSYGHNNLNSESFRLFTDPLPVAPMIHDLIREFIDNGIDYLVSPYDSSFQLSYLYHSKVIDSIYGSTDLLLTNVEKFILGMEFQSKDFRFVDKKKILSELSLSERQFFDLSIMVGCNIQPLTFSNLPPLPKPNPVQPFPQLSYFKLGLDIIFQYLSFNPNSTDLYGYIASLNDPVSLQLYLQGLSAIKFMPVLNVDGEILLYSAEMAKLGKVDKADLLQAKSETPEPTETPEATSTEVKIPNDIHDFISQRLPGEFYFYQSIGLIPLDLLGAITHGKYSVRPPPESGLSDSYKKLVTSTYFNEVIDNQLNLLTQLLTRYYQVKKVEVNYWFKDEKVLLNNRLTPPTSRKVSHLIDTSDSTEPFSLINFFSGLKSEYKPGTETDAVIKTSRDIISTALLRSLFVLGIIDNKTHELTSFGKILQAFVKENANELNEAYLQELIVLLVLIKSNCLKLNETNKSYSSVPKFFKEPTKEDIDLTSDDLNKVTLVARILSIHKFNIHPINYQGPISRALLNFRSHLKYVQGILSNTLQTTMTDFIVKQEHNNIKFDYTREQWCTLIAQLPFYKDVNNTLLGVITEIYLEYALKLKKSGSSQNVASESKDHLLNTVFQIANSSFNINVNGMNSIKASQFTDDLKEGFGLWSLFVKLVKVANAHDKTLISDVYCKQIVETGEWLKEFELSE